MVIGSFSTAVSSVAASSAIASILARCLASAISVRRLPSVVLSPNFASMALISSIRRSERSFGEERSFFSSFCSLVSDVMLGADFHFLELAQGAQAHVEDRVGLDLGELERLHQRRLGLILGADDLDDLVEVQIDGEIAFQHLEPRRRSFRGDGFERRSSTSRR